MILFFMEWLKEETSFRLPQVFHYYSTRMMLAAITSLLITIFLGPWFIRKVYLLKNESSIRTEDIPLLAELHQKKKTTPTMGGALILIVDVDIDVFVDGLGECVHLDFVFDDSCFGLLERRDDYLKMKLKNSKGISGKKKLLIQALLGLFVALYLIVPTFSEIVHEGTWYVPPVIKEVVKEKPDDISKRRCFEEVTMAPPVSSIKKRTSPRIRFAHLCTLLQRSCRDLVRCFFHFGDLLYPVCHRRILQCRQPHRRPRRPRRWMPNNGGHVLGPFRLFVEPLPAGQLSKHRLHRRQRRDSHLPMRFHWFLHRIPVV